MSSQFSSEAGRKRPAAEGRQQAASFASLAGSQAFGVGASQAPHAPCSLPAEPWGQEGHRCPPCDPTPTCRGRSWWAASQDRVPPVFPQASDLQRQQRFAACVFGVRNSRSWGSGDLPAVAPFTQPVQ